MTTIKQIQVTYDDELEVPFPTPLFAQLKVSNSDITYISSLTDSLLTLNYGVMPIFATIFVKIQTEVWEYAVKKVIDGLIGLVKQKWFGCVSNESSWKSEDFLVK